MCTKLHQKSPEMVPKVVKMEVWGGHGASFGGDLDPKESMWGSCGVPGTFSVILGTKWRPQGSPNEDKMVSQNDKKWCCILGRFSEPLWSRFGRQNERIWETFYHFFDDTYEKCGNVDLSTALKREAHFQGFKVMKTDQKMIPKAPWNHAGFGVDF